MVFGGLIARQDNAGLGIALMLFAWFLFAFVDTSVKWLVLLGIPVIQVAFVRYFVHLIAALVTSAVSGDFRVVKPKGMRKILIVRAILLMTTTVFNFLALKYLSLTMTSSIMFSSPIVVSLLSVPLLGERVGPWRWFAILTGFAGVLVVIRPFGETFHWAALLVVYNACAMALFSISTRKLSGQVSTQSMQLHAGLWGTVCLAPFALMVWVTPEKPLDWALFLGIGLFAWFGHDMFSRAHSYAASALLMPFSYSFIIFLTISSYVVFDDLPDRLTVAGAAIIIASGLLIWWRENFTAAQARLKR